jgi:hypothetical protein
MRSRCDKIVLSCATLEPLTTRDNLRPTAPLRFVRLPVLTNRCRILTSRGSGPPPPAAEVLDQSIEGLAGFTQLLGHQMLAIDAQPLRQPRSVATCSRQRLGDAVIGRYGTEIAIRSVLAVACGAAPDLVARRP